MQNFNVFSHIFSKVIRAAAMCVFFVSTFHALEAPAAECSVLVQNLGELSRTYYARLADWGSRWKTFEGAKENALNLALKQSSPASDKLFMGFITKIENPQNLTWHQTPVKKFIHSTHLGIGSRLAEAMGTTYTPSTSYYLSVFSGLENILSELPNVLIRPLTKFTFKQKMELRLPALLATYYFTYDFLSNKYDKRLVNKILKEADARAVELDEMIAYDYRFAELNTLLETLKNTDISNISDPELLRMKDLFDQGKIDQRQIRLMALVYSKLLQKYYSYMEKEFATETPEESFTQLMGNPLFQHVRTLVMDGKNLQAGFRPMEGASKAAAGKNALSPAEVSGLIDLQHMTLEKQNMIPLLTKSLVAQNKTRRNISLLPEERQALDVIREIRQYPERAAILDDILNDEYSKFLFILFERGSINALDLQYRLGEDAYYQRRFAEYELLKVERMVMNEDGSFSEEVLTLDLMRKINARELGKKISEAEKKAAVSRRGSVRGPASVPRKTKPPPEKTEFNSPLFFF